MLSKCNGKSRGGKNVQYAGHKRNSKSQILNLQPRRARRKRHEEHEEKGDTGSTMQDTGYKKNPKFEVRNPKQIQISKYQMFQTRTTKNTKSKKINSKHYRYPLGWMLKIAL